MIYNFDIAQNIYDEGAHSESYARVNVTTTGGLPEDVVQGQVVQAISISGTPITGTVCGDYSAGSTLFRFLYDTDDSLSTVCHVGQLPEDIQATDGCINDTGTIEIDGATPIQYEYDHQIHNYNEQTIARLSLDAKDMMHDCATCPYLTYDKFYNYYGEFDYAHQWVVSAFDRNETDFKLGNGDFSKYGDLGRAGKCSMIRRWYYCIVWFLSNARVPHCVSLLFWLEFVQKATLMMNIWMYVIGQMEDALDQCVSGPDTYNGEAVHAWDEAVAYYVGSLQGKPGNEDGALLYNLANFYCGYFKTCGESSNQASGNSAVNIRIMRAFSAAQNDINMGQCDAARKRKVEIETAMAIPLIQGSIMYSYLRDYAMSEDNYDDRDHVDATGAVFAASVLPLVHSCNTDDAQVIYDYMRAGLFDSDYPAVRAAFENNFQCLGVTCADVGGIYDASKGYLLNASPCADSGSVNVGAIVGGIIEGSLVCCS
jgi:hypothetical protein